MHRAIGGLQECKGETRMLGNQYSCNRLTSPKLHAYKLPTYILVQNLAVLGVMSHPSLRVTCALRSSCKETSGLLFFAQKQPYLSPFAVSEQAPMAL